MANPTTCPKCGRQVDATAFICPACEFILDTSFLGDDITDDERDRRAHARRAADPRGVNFGEDAIILGDSDGEWSDFSSRDAAGMTREVTQARFYIGGSAAALLHEDAVPEVVPGVTQGSLKMTPFEQHVLQFMNGKRSMGRIQKKSGMEDTEFKATAAMLADKGLIRLRTTKKRKKGRDGMLRSQSSRTAVPLLEGERTVVAPTPIEPSVARRPAVAKPDGPPRTAPSRSEVTALKNVEVKKSRMPGPASVRLLEEEKIDDRGAAGAFGEGAYQENISNVFARASVPPVSPAALAASSAAVLRPTADKSAVQAKPPSAIPSPPPPSAEAPNERSPSLPEESAEPVSLLPPGGDADFEGPLGEGDGFELGRDASELRTDQRELAKRATEPEPAAARNANDQIFDELSNPTALGDLRPVPPAASLEEERPGSEGGRVLGTRPMIHDALTANLPPLSDVPTGPAPARAPDEDDGGEDATGDVAGAVAVPIDEREEPPPARHEAEQDEAEQDEDEQDEDEQDEDEQDEDEQDEDEQDEDERDEDEQDEDDIEAAGFEVELRTEALEAKVEGQSTGPAPPPILELPSDALQPLPSSVLHAPSPPAPPPAAVPPAPTSYLPPPSHAAAISPPPLPGQQLARPAAPTRPVAAAAAAAVARPSPASPNRPPTVGGGGLAPRPSQQSKVPFEQARKAEKIYEQAIKDHSEGRLSSARMNVKLAVMYDPSVPAYQEFLEELDRAGAGAKSPNAGKPRELLLFEQASGLEGKGDYEGAVKLLMEAIETAPRAAALRNRLGVVLSIRLKRHEEALAHLKVAIDLEPGNIVYMNNYSKVTGMLDSELERGPEKSRGKKGEPEKIAIKKMRPKMF